MSDNQVIIRKRYSSAFVLDRAKLSRILDIIEQRFKDEHIPFAPKYEATLRNNKRILLTSSDELLKLDNTVRNPIRVLKITASDRANEPQIEIIVSYDSDTRNNIFIYVRATVDKSKWANQFFAEIEEQVERTFHDSWILKYVKRASIIYAFAYVLAVALLTPVMLNLFFRSDGFLSAVSYESNFYLTNSDVAELKEESSRVISLEDKIDFLYDLSNKQLATLSTERPKPTVRSDTSFDFQALFSLKNLFIALPIIVVIGCATYAVVFCYPRIVFLWGDYEVHYANLVSRRKSLWNIVILSTILGILSNFFVVALSDSIR